MHMQRRMYHRFDGYDELKPLLDGPEGEILGAFHGKPVLIRIPAATTVAAPRGRLVSCLLHGNEPAGFRAVVEVLRRGERFPFDLWVLIGNVRAATEDGLYAHRHLDDQEDFNRVWGVEGVTSTSRRCAAAILDELGTADLEAAVDIHNNTGRNPYYAVLPQPTPASRRLAALCADTVLVWRLQADTLMEALAPRCPVVAVECGPPDDLDGVAFASAVVHRVLGAEGFGDGPGEDTGESADVRPAPGPDPRPRLIETHHRVTVRPDVDLSFGPVDGDAVHGKADGRIAGGGIGSDDTATRVVIDEALDAHNFAVLPAGHTIGRLTSGRSMPLRAIEVTTGRDATGDLFGVTADGRIVARADLAPIMITTTVLQTRRDCLLYTTRPAA